MPNSQAPTRRLARAASVRAPKTGTVSHAAAADALPSSANRRQLGRRVAAVSARYQLVAEHGVLDDRLLLRLTREVLEARPLSARDNAAVIKVATSAAHYLTSAPTLPGTHWLGRTWHDQRLTPFQVPLLVFEHPAVTYADVVLVGAQRFVRRDAVAVANYTLDMVADTTGHRLDGVRVFVPARPHENRWIPAADRLRDHPLASVFTATTYSEVRRAA